MEPIEERSLDANVKPAELKELFKWQNKLMPWLIGMPSGLVLVFIVLATQQMRHFNKALETRGDSDLIGSIIPPPSDVNTNAALKKDLNYIKCKGKRGSVI